jgi:hypothetical protein
MISTMTGCLDDPDSGHRRHLVLLFGPPADVLDSADGVATAYSASRHTDKTDKSPT